MKHIILGFLLASLAVSFSWANELPPLKPQPSPQQVVDEHIDALNECDWNRLMAQYPPEVRIILPDGEEAIGRKAVGELFAGFCKPYAEHGLKGLKFTTLSTFTVEGTVNVQWSADAEFLSEPYKGADAYVTKDGFMYAQVTTFDGTKLKFK